MKTLVRTFSFLLILSWAINSEAIDFGKIGINETMGSYSASVQDDVDIKSIPKEMDAVNIAIARHYRSNPRLQEIFIVGDPEELDTTYFIELDLPDYLKDVDGGTIRLIMHHETMTPRKIVINNVFVITEYKDNSTGIYGITKIKPNGKKWKWVLGDAKPDELYKASGGWARIVDNQWAGRDGAVLGGEKIRIYSAAGVTTRVILMD